MCSISVHSPALSISHFLWLFLFAKPLCLNPELVFLLAVFDEEFHLAVVRHAYTPEFLRGVFSFCQIPSKDEKNLKSARVRINL